MVSDKAMKGGESLWERLERRAPWGVVSLQLALGVAAALTPGLQNAGYKGFLVLGVAMSLSLPLAWMSRHWGRTRAPLSMGVWQRAVAFLCVALVAPAVVIVAAFLTTQGCEIGDGVAMLALGTLPGCALAFALTELLEHWAPRWRRALYGVIWLLLLAQAVRWFMSEPVYQVAHPLVGMLLGPPNENPEVLTARAGWFALEVWCWAALALGAAGLGEEGWWRARWWRYALIVVGASGALTLVSQDADLGYRIDDSRMRHELRAIEIRDGVEHVMAPNIPTDAREWLKLDAAFERERQRSLFGLSDEQMPEMTIYWHRTRSSKRELTGASRTKFAKVHLGELYISTDDFPASTLAHEMAHVTSGAFSDTFLKVPGRFGGLWYNPALVEGFAVAVAWTDFPLSAHEAARRAIKTDRAPELASLFSPLGFATTNLSVAYRLSGSFVRYCLDEYGAEPVADWYRSQDFEAAFGVPLSEVEARWRSFLMDEARAAAINSDLKRVDRIQKRPSITQESCERGALDRSLRRAMDVEADDEVARILEVMTEEGETDDLAKIWLAREEYRVQRADYDCTLNTPDFKVKENIQRRLDYLKALTLWRRGDLSGAAAAFDALSESVRRGDNVILARLMLREGLPFEAFIIDADIDPTLKLARLWEEHRHPAIGYKLAQRLRRAQRYESLYELCKTLSWDGVAFPEGFEGTLKLATQDMLGQSAFSQRDWGTARRAFKGYTERAPTAGRRAYGETWLARTDFFEAHQARLPSNLPRL